MDNARPLKLGWSPWADAEVVSLMAAQLIQSRLNVPVERVMADIGIQYESVARGDLDLMLMAWLLERIGITGLASGIVSSISGRCIRVVSAGWFRTTSRRRC